MLKAVLIDDEEIALDVLEIMLNDVGGVSVIRKFDQATEALDYLNTAAIDLIFLDIEMPGLNGLDVAKRIALICPNATIIFVTAYQEYAVDSFDVNAFGYLLKPVAKEKLANTLDRYNRRFRSIEEKQIPSTVPTAPTHLYFNVLGSTELYDQHSNLLKWRTKKAKELGIYLWHHAGAPVQRDRILEDLWPELPSDKAQTLFHTTLYHLRSTLKKAGFSRIVMFGDERYWMRTSGIVSDLERLEKLMQNPDDHGEQIQEMIKLYRGDYLEEESYSWADERRFELRGAYLQLLQRIKLQVGQTERMMILRKMIALEPYEEANYRLLIQELQDIGDTTAAQALREQMIQRFKELGIDI